ncbi:MAG: Obg family GTPase CgtA, partial [Candidatus Margulisiibacteriota bacterium]
GGDGGKGGNVILLPTNQKQTLMDLKIHPEYKAENGHPGKGKNQTGKCGQDYIIKMPKGVMVFDDQNNLIVDLVTEDPFVIAKGGIGGKGNAKFVSSVNRTPRYAQTGLPGEMKSLHFELRLIAELGLIGMPNAGKSTLLKKLTNANPKIANYPFTTLYPNLGVLKFEDKELIIADIPGLIEGASNGVGLGSDFLRHIARTKALIHLVEIIPDNVEMVFLNYLTVVNELTKSNPELMEKSQLVVLNKTDLITDSELTGLIDFFKEKNITPLVISSITGFGIGNLIKTILRLDNDFSNGADLKALEN